MYTIVKDEKQRSLLFELVKRALYTDKSSSLLLAKLCQLSMKKVSLKGKLVPKKLSLITRSEIKKRIQVCSGD